MAVTIEGLSAVSDIIEDAKKRVEGLETFTIEAGIVGADGGETPEYIDPNTGEGIGVSVAYIAAVHEFGVGVPKRSPVADFADGTTGDLGNFQQTVDEGVDDALAGEITTEELANQIAEAAAVGIRNAILDGNFTALAESTLRQRERGGNSRSDPLFDTGQIFDNVRGVVTRG